MDYNFHLDNELTCVYCDSHVADFARLFSRCGMKSLVGKVMIIGASLLFKYSFSDTLLNHLTTSLELTSSHHWILCRGPLLPALVRANPKATKRLTIEMCQELFLIVLENK